MKEWLTGLMPDGMSRNEIADALGLSRKTVSQMLNPNQDTLGSGLTMFSYLRFVGAVVDAPEESPGASRLAKLEATVDRTGAATTSSLADLTARLQAVEHELKLLARRAKAG